MRALILAALLAGCATDGAIRDVMVDRVVHPDGRTASCQCAAACK